MKYVKHIAAGLSATILTAGAVAGASAQELVPLPGFNQGGQEQTQDNNGRQNYGQFRSKLNHAKGQLSNLTFEEQQEKMVEHIDRTIENLNSKLEAVSSNDEMDEELKNQIITLINEQLAALPSFKEQIINATDEEALKEIMKSMKEQSKGMMEFMKENRPSKEDMKEKWDNLSFEEKQEKILANMTQKEEHLNEMLAEIASAKEQIEAATSNEELMEILKELRPQKRGQKKGPGNSQFGHRQGQAPQGQQGPQGQQNPQGFGF